MIWNIEIEIDHSINASEFDSELFAWLQGLLMYLFASHDIRRRYDY